GRQHRESVVLILRETIFNDDVLALDIARFFQALAKRRQDVCILAGPPAVEKSDHGHRRLLRVRRERPRGRRAAEQRDELAPFHAEHGDFLAYALLARQPTRALSFPAHQPAIERPASPWGRPELF